MCRAIVAVLAAIGFVAVAFVGMNSLFGQAHPFDKMMVLSVATSPDGRSAAFSYLYHFADASSTTLRIALHHGAPFPKEGDALPDRPYDVLAVDASIQGFRYFADLPKAQELSRRLVSFSWTPDGRLDVCPGDQTTLLVFRAASEVIARPEGAVRLCNHAGDLKRNSNGQ